MCGISFVVHSNKTPRFTDGKIMRSAAYNTFMRESMVAGMLRGTDSSGIFQVDDNHKPYTHKTPLPGMYFVQDKAAQPFFNDVYECLITVSHVRAATSGNVSLSNAHPFRSSARIDGTSIIGVHNGSLTSVGKGDWKRNKNGARYDVDSEWALNHIAQEGIDGFADIEGAYSFVWWDDASPGHLLFARNDQRPMCMMRSKDGRSIIGGSEAGLLSWLAERNSMSMEDVVYTTEPDVMYRINTDKDYLELEDMGMLPFSYERYTTTTAAVTKKPAAVIPLIEYERAAAGLSDEEEEYDAWDLADTGYTAAAACSVGSAWAMDDYGKDGMVKAIKDALKLGRKFVNTAARDDTDDEGYNLNYHMAPKEWYSHANTTAAEREAAERDGSYGMLVTYQPVEWDSGSNEIVGEIMEPGDAKNTLAFVRNIGTVVYHEEFRDRMLQMVIVGLTAVNNGEPEYLVAPLTDKGEQELRAMAA